MTTITVKNLPDDVYRRVKFHAAHRGISLEAAVREILDEATRPAEKPGSMVAAFARERSEEFPAVKRDDTPPEPAVYE